MNPLMQKGLPNISQKRPTHPDHKRNQCTGGEITRQDIYIQQLEAPPPIKYYQGSQNKNTYESIQTPPQHDAHLG